MKSKKQKMFFSLIMVCLVFNSIIITEIFAATTVVIYEPQLGQNYNDLLNHEYIEFYFRIYGGFQTYSTFIDGQYDPDLKHVGVNIFYDVNLFISRYGRGVHTFTVTAKASGLVPMGMIKDGRASTIIESVEFEVIPVMCHFVGFGYDEYDDERPYRWRSNIETFKEILFESDRAKYIPGYSAIHYEWFDWDVRDILETLAIKEIEKDVVVVLFSSHGHTTLFEVDSWTHSHSNTIFGTDWTPYYMGVTGIDLKGWLTNLETNNLIYIVETCHSEGFLEHGEYLTNNKHIMVACEYDEDSTSEARSWSSTYDLVNKIRGMHSPFLRIMCENFYYGYNTTEEAFENAYDWITIDHPHWNQHPMDSCDLQTPLYLCRPP